MSTIRVSLRSTYDSEKETINVPQSFKKGDGERPVAMDVLVTSTKKHVQLIDYGVLDGVARKHHKKKEER